MRENKNIIEEIRW